MGNKGINIVEFTKGAKPLNKLKGKRVATDAEREKIIVKYCTPMVIRVLVSIGLACISLVKAIKSFEISFWYFALACIALSLSICVIVINEIEVAKRVKCSYNTVRCRMSKVDGSHNCIWLNSEEGEIVDSWFVVDDSVVRAGRNDEPLLLVFGETGNGEVLGNIVLIEGLEG